MSSLDSSNGVLSGKPTKSYGKPEFANCRKFPAGPIRSQSLDRIQPFCRRARGARAACYVQTVSWSNGARDRKAYRAMNAAWLEGRGRGWAFGGFHMFPPSWGYPKMEGL